MSDNSEHKWMYLTIIAIIALVSLVVIFKSGDSCRGNSYSEMALNRAQLSGVDGSLIGRAYDDDGNWVDEEESWWDSWWSPEPEVQEEQSQNQGEQPSVDQNSNPTEEFAAPAEEITYPTEQEYVQDWMNDYWEEQVVVASEETNVQDVPVQQVDEILSQPIVESVTETNNVDWMTDYLAQMMAARAAYEVEQAEYAARLQAEEQARQWMMQYMRETDERRAYYQNSFNQYQNNSDDNGSSYNATNDSWVKIIETINTNGSFEVTGYQNSSNGSWYNGSYTNYSNYSN